MRDLLRILRFRVASRGRARVSRSARVSAGARILVGPGAHVVVFPGAVLGSRSRIEAVAGEVTVGPGARLGERAIVVAHVGVMIGARAVLGDWAVVSDVAPGFGDVERPIRVQPPASSALVV